MERNEKDKLVLELLNKLNSWIRDLHETQDLHLSDLRDMENFEWKLRNAFEFCQGASFDEENRLKGDCGGDYMFKENPMSWDSLKNECTYDREKYQWTKNEDEGK